MKISKKKIRKLFYLTASVFLSALVIATVTLLWNQDKIVQKIITDFNQGFKGALVIEDTDIEPFANFPYISIAIRNVQVYEDKADMFAPILDVSDIHLGLNFWSLVSGDVKVNMLKVENGNFDIYRYADGNFNLVNALKGETDINELRETYNIELKKIELSNLDIIKYDESTRIHVETYIENATSHFRNSEEVLMIGLESQVVLNVINDGDSTFLTHKRFNTKTELDYNRGSGILTVAPTEIRLKNAFFQVEGKVDVLDEFNVDIDIDGNNPNFNLLIALAPKELIPTLEEYENAGNIYFKATLDGKTLSGEQPAIYAEFGCDSAYFKNPTSQKQLEEISFNGYFTNGSERNYSTMEFALENMTAKPEAGIFNANLHVSNFETPQIDLTVKSNFDLDFLAKFLNIQRLRQLDGDVSLEMNFADIIDLKNPEKSLEKFNKSYFSELLVEDLTFMLPDYHLKFDSIDIKATMDGNHANIEYLFMNIGGSDLTIRGDIDDLPAVIHQSFDTIEAKLFVFSSLIDIRELTSKDTIAKKPVDEKIENMRLELGFKTTAKKLLNSPNLPVGEFFINHFYGKMQHYPHTLKNFSAHVHVSDEELKIEEFYGRIDKSEFIYRGILDNYPLLLSENRQGSVDVDFALTSDQVRLNDLFTYNGENYVPPDYREEIIDDVRMYGNAEFVFADSLVETEVFFDQLSAYFQVHDMQLKDIHGKFDLSNEFVILNGMSGFIGNTDLTADMTWYTGDDDSVRKANNFIAISAQNVDFDQLSNYSSRSQDEGMISDSDSVFNIYELPFTDLKFSFDFDQMRYHKHMIRDVNADLRIQKDHFLFVDTLVFLSAGGHFDIRGYFNGSDPDSIFFYPNMQVKNVNLEQMLYRFDNFGQEYIISDNLVGQFSGAIKGKIHMHANMIPQLDESEIYLDFEIINGSLKNYKPLNALSDYFTDKNLAHIRFDTLSNQLEVVDGIINIPNMTINSTLGYMDISGYQSLDSHMEYYFRVPLKIVTKAAWSKLFGKKKAIQDSTNIDAIQYKNRGQKHWYVNLKLEGTPDNYSVSLGKREKSKG